MTALSNLMKLWAILCRSTQNELVMVESSDKMWSTGEGNGKPLQYSCLENPRNSMKRQKRYDTHALASANAFLSPQPSPALSTPFLTTSTCSCCFLVCHPCLPWLCLPYCPSPINSCYRHLCHQLSFCTSYQFSSLFPSAVQPLNWTPKYLVPTDYGVWCFKICF